MDRVRRLPVETLQEIRAADLRPQLPADATAAALPGGGQALIRWRSIGSSFGAAGRELLVICPACGASRRLLRRQLAGPWRCAGCLPPLLWPSQARPGGRRSKPPTYRLAQLHDRAARLCRRLDLPPPVPPSPVVESRRQLLPPPPRPRHRHRLTHKKRAALLQQIAAIDAEHQRLQEEQARQLLQRVSVLLAADLLQEMMPAA